MGEQTNTINTALIEVMREVKAIPKDQKNNHFGYQFRGIDSVYQHLQPIMAKHGVFMTMERINGDIIRWWFHHESGTKVSSDMKSPKLSPMTTKEGNKIDTNRTFQVDGMAVSYSHRNILTSTFLIPTGQGDLDSIETDMPIQDDAATKRTIVDCIKCETGSWSRTPQEVEMANWIYGKLPDEWDDELICSLIGDFQAANK